ncbi:MAG: CBS domain-containing protein [Thermoplasmata archaeon]|nr:MAG: CBS domain-containing protein [Thermoplasmata archaeon]
MEINEVVTKDKPKIVRGDMPLVDAMSQLRSSPSSALVVEPEEKSDAYGIVTTRDIVFRGLARGVDPTTTPVSKVMTKPVLILNNLHLDLRYAALAMANAEVEHVLVFDGEHMVGELGLHDVLVARWKECSRQQLDRMVSDVGGGC